MDLAVIRYVVFVVVTLILIWAILEMRWRYLRKSKQPRIRRSGSWIDFDPTASKAADEEPLVVADEDSTALDAKASWDLHSRAQQNGHYSGSKKTL